MFKGLPENGELIFAARSETKERYGRWNKNWRDGANPYKLWFNALDAQAAAKIVTAKLRLELGNTSNVKWFDGIGECVVDWGPGYRIYLAKDGETLIILFGGGTKRRQQRDVDRAKGLRAEYRARKKTKSSANKTENGKR